MAKSVSDVSVNFAHLSCELTSKELSRYGSPHVSRREAYLGLYPSICARTSTAMYSTAIDFQRSQIYCANEVFPEAVSADPLADLEIWDEWRQNIRRFPYPGLFSPLAISSQAGKTTSTTSVGVIGEIMAGLLSQAYIAPWVIVRPIRRFPDFIFLQHNDLYAFVESKAFTGARISRRHPLDAVPRSVMEECVTDAVQQLNADPFVTVWYALTEICTIDPVELSVVFLEFNAPDASRRSRQNRFLPEAVRKGLAERAVSAANAFFNDAPDNLSKTDRKSALIENAIREARQLVNTTVPKSLSEESIDAVGEEVTNLAQKVSNNILEEGKRLVAAKRQAAAGRFGEIRPTTDGALFIVDLSYEQRARLERTWQPSWSNSCLPWMRLHDVDFWRCSSAAVGHGAESLKFHSVEDSEG